MFSPFDSDEWLVPLVHHYDAGRKGCRYNFVRQVITTVLPIQGAELSIGPPKKNRRYCFLWTPLLLALRLQRARRLPIYT